MEKRKHNMRFLQPFKLLIQIVSFIVLPAFYINAFAGIHEIYLEIIHGSFDISALLPQILETVAVIPITILFGRFFCGWMCAFGTLGDVIYLLSSKVFKTKYRMDETADGVLKSLKYLLLIFLVIIVWSFGINTFDTSNPWDVFGFIFTFGKTPAVGYAASTLMPGFIILILILAASFFVERFFCRYLCPLGAIFSIASKLRITKIRKPGDQCGKCMICTQNCKMGISLYKKDVVTSGECINCFKCIAACPRKNINLTVDEKDLRPVVAGVLAASIISGTYYVGTIAANPSTINYSYSDSVSSDVNNKNVSTSADQSNSNKIYKDGTYQGTGIGFRGGTTTVSLTVKNDIITDVQVMSSEDDEPFFNRACNTVIDEILSTQSSKVNAVSGATYSSNGIMSAVSDALSAASLS